MITSLITSLSGRTLEICRQVYGVDWNLNEKHLAGIPSGCKW